MTIHKEGYKIIGIATLIFGAITLLCFTFLSEEVPWLSYGITLASLAVLLFIVSFFRIPSRFLTISAEDIVCPADGKVVVIEEITDTEYFMDKRIQVSIFMSPANVHVNRNPVSGVVRYSRYHPGEYLVAWHPKSSAENERFSVVLQNEKGEILVKQIAGALARRICNYLAVGENIKQGNEMGFIKFGSRVDVLLPPNAKIRVKLNEVVKGGVTVLASW